MTTGLTDTDARVGRWVLALIAIVAIAAGVYYWTGREAAQPATDMSPPVAVEPDPAQPVVEPPLETPDTPSLPALGQSDAEVLLQLDGLSTAGRIESLLVPEEIIRRITATVDNLTREKVAARIRPVRPMDPPFIAEGTEAAPVLGQANYVRYTSYVDFVESLDLDQVVAAYVRLYPLFQEAYEELGNPTAHFNDRLIEVIDHLLDAPEIRGEIPLSRPSVMYQFADAGLEARSAGQKFLIRMGPANADRIKTWLRDLRGRLAARRPT
jgi:hypothetical protein